jgi:DNA-binding CsgD family transcriptional regulator
LLLAVASNAAEYAGDPDLVVAIGELAGGLEVEESPFLQLVRYVLVGLRSVAAVNFDAAVLPLRRAVEFADDLVDEGLTEFPTPSGLSVVEQPVPLLFAGRAALRLGDDDAAHRIHRRAAMRSRSSGAFSILTQVLPRLALCELWAGRWPSAAASAKEGLALARDIGQGTLGAHLLAVATLLSALRGDEDECRSRAKASRERAAARGLTLVDDLTNWALTVLELGLGRPAEAFEHARRLVAVPTVAWAAADRVEAAVRAGEPSVAADWLEPFAAWANAVASPWARAASLRCRAILAEDPAVASDFFSAALAAHAGATRPFERARTELAFGELLRRSRRRIDARRHLQEAVDTFEGLGAVAWAERARGELRASGRTARTRDPSTIDQLTEQEVQIAGFVADGLTNRDVAAHLFVSPRTVDFHLRNIFRKLGITSRTELARLDLGTDTPLAR